jgi:hypothetical protein
MGLIPGPKVPVTSVAVSSGVGCKRCGCRMRAPLDDLCAPCRQKVDETEQTAKLEEPT